VTAALAETNAARPGFVARKAILVKPQLLSAATTQSTNYRMVVRTCASMEERKSGVATPAKALAKNAS